MMLFCLLVFVFIAVKPNRDKNNEKKIADYLQSKYSEESMEVKFLSTVQNKDSLDCDGSTFFSWKVEDSFKHYYKAYSTKNDLEFYLCYDKSKEGNLYKETYQDTYLTYLALRDNSDKILKEISNIGFDGFVEYSNVKEDVRGKVDIPEEGGDILKELSIVSEDINEYEKSPYYINKTGRAGSADTELYFKLNINLDTIINQYKYTIIQLANSIQDINNNFNQFNPHDPNFHFIGINIIIITSDNYVIEMVDDVAYVKYRNGIGERNKPKVMVYKANSNDSRAKSFYDY